MCNLVGMGIPVYLLDLFLCLCFQRSLWVARVSQLHCRRDKKRCKSHPPNESFDRSPLEREIKRIILRTSHGEILTSGLNHQLSDQAWLCRKVLIGSKHFDVEQFLRILIFLTEHALITNGHGEQVFSIYLYLIDHDWCPSVDDREG